MAGRGRRARRGAATNGGDGRRQFNTNSNTTHRQNQNVAPAAKRQDDLQFLPSISRSGGDNGEGDTLKDEGIQNKSWVLVMNKISSYKEKYPLGHSKNKHQSEEESNILLNLRKLREGILSTRRKDGMALSVYETSLLAAMAFQNSFQAVSPLTHLIKLYTMLLLDPPKGLDAGKVRLRVQALAVISLLFYLEENPSSQRAYYAHLKTLSTLELDWDCQGLHWVTSLRTSIASRNYSQIFVTTNTQKIKSVLEDLSRTDVLDQHLVEMAVRVLLDGLRRKLRNTVWIVVRSAYREFNLSNESATVTWLFRLLMLDATDASERTRLLEWMKERQAEGHCLPKEGVEGRWTLRRPVS